jgi:uncharacterized protein (UPF0335 family)
METALFALLGLALIATVSRELHERRIERLERLNRESWEVLQTARRIHDEAAAALQSMFDEARTTAKTVNAKREIDQ